MLFAEIIISTGWTTTIIITVIVTLLYLLDKIRTVKNQQLVDKATNANMSVQADKFLAAKLREKELNFQQKETQLKLDYQTWAFTEFEKFKKYEVERIKAELKEQSIEYASTLLQQWKIEAEGQIRQDAINRSYSVNLGKITEHLIPFHKSFLSQFNPKDARFLGSPIDLVVFDGYADKKSEITIWLVEIKTGKSKLSDTQKRIKEAVKNGNIRWKEINPDNSLESSLV